MGWVGWTEYIKKQKNLGLGWCGYCHTLPWTAPPLTTSVTLWWRICYNHKNNRIIKIKINWNWNLKVDLNLPEFELKIHDLSMEEIEVNCWSKLEWSEYCCSVSSSIPSGNSLVFGFSIDEDFVLNIIVELSKLDWN